MRGAMQLALEDAHVSASDVDYVNAHGTGTEIGDIAESQATHAVFKREVPISTMKGYTGHTLGACGAMEVAFSPTWGFISRAWAAFARWMRRRASR